MLDHTPEMSVTIPERQQLISVFPCFTSLNLEQIKSLAKLMHECKIQPNDLIVKEDDLIDSIYIIYSGRAEVTRAMQDKKKMVQVPVAMLTEGEAIGLNDTGFYSSTGKRTATVTALTEMVVLKIDIKDLYAFLHANNLELSMHAASDQMLKMRLIKQSLPFAKLSHERLAWLAKQVEIVHISAGQNVFSQGETGDKCYLIRSGQIEIIAHDESGGERQITTLKSPALFGEATLLTHTRRNATAKAISDCELLMIRYEYLSELIESESAVADMFMTLMVDRSQPVRNPDVSIHQRKTKDGQYVTILKNPNTNSYFKLSSEGAFIWNLLDGKHTIQDITLELAEKLDLFAPNLVAGLVSKLSHSGFITNIKIDEQSMLQKRSGLRYLVAKITSILNFRKTFGDADKNLTYIYNKYLFFFFSKIGLSLLTLLIGVGIFTFLYNTNHMLHFFQTHHIGGLLLFSLIPLSLVGVVLHELGHAFAVKAFGKEVHYIGVGWCWIGPIAFTDTSDMWIAPRKERMLVNLAGSYVDILLAGIASILIFVVPSPYVQAVLWLWALYAYLGAIRMLSPLQDMDGYYVLMDWLEKPRLRQVSVIWLVKKFPKCLRRPALFKQSYPEIIYWLSCIIFIVLISAITLLIQGFVFKVIGLAPSNPYLTLMLPILAAILSSLSIISDIRNQVDE